MAAYLPIMVTLPLSVLAFFACASAIARSYLIHFVTGLTVQMDMGVCPQTPPPFLIWGGVWARDCRLGSRIDQRSGDVVISFNWNMKFRKHVC